jgi:hypothetical protein
LCAAVLGLSTTALVGPAAHARHLSDPAVVADWNSLATRTVFAEGLLPPPSGQLYLGLVSLAVLDATNRARRGQHHSARVSAVAAAAVAAHDVLVEYFPASAAKLDDDLATSLDAVPDGEVETRGVRIGQQAAHDLVEARRGDGRDAAISFTKPRAIGVWRPLPDAKMVVPWLGFVTPLLLRSPTQIQPDGPDAVTSRGYADDLEEVKELGALNGSRRTPAQTDTALFWNDNVVRQMQESLRTLAAQRSLGLRQQARMFALVNATAADSLITCWRQKYDVGFWRPVTAIHEAAVDGNPATTADLAWQPLVTTPSYPEYASGHACVVGAVTRSLRLFFGTDHVQLDVASTVPRATTRHFSSLRALRAEAFHARIWLGLHFRDAMQDGNLIGRRAADHGYAHLRRCGPFSSR